MISIILIYALANAGVIVGPPAALNAVVAVIVYDTYVHKLITKEPTVIDKRSYIIKRGLPGTQSTHKHIERTYNYNQNIRGYND